MMQPTDRKHPTGLPAVVIINGRRYAVTDMSTVERAGGLGHLVYATAEIGVDGKLDLAGALRTLAHECAHVFQADMDLNFCNDEASRFAHWTQELFTRNPLLLDCYRRLTEELAP